MSGSARLRVRVMCWALCVHHARACSTCMTHINSVWTICCHRYSLEDDVASLDEMPLMMSEEGFENEESDYQTLPRARVEHARGGVLGGWKMLCGRYIHLYLLSFILCCVCVLILCVCVC